MLPKVIWMKQQRKLECRWSISLDYNLLSLNLWFSTKPFEWANKGNANFEGHLVFKWNESKIEKMLSKTVVILYDFFTWGCKCASVCVRMRLWVRYFWLFFFSIFESFHFLNCLMIVVLQKKNSMKPRGRSLNSMNYIYIYIYIIMSRW